ncbi:hypothetical protein B0G62_102140 [Paraburkholderia eburnea]|uniref:Uncharacterized protein n=1 Tax=Paraburkholderia eburnea TaxID=1189126 RepID=A0A2S4MIH5_9BURK|nr:hypothetical protein B0G62_102140 [Paraburkholderia eburnea]PRZ19747.1 hypothetical protein BX588_114140 [Paraburkholderia eburnea]
MSKFLAVAIDLSRRRGKPEVKSFLLRVGNKAALYFATDASVRDVNVNRPLVGHGVVASGDLYCSPLVLVGLCVAMPMLDLNSRHVAPPG